jgi:hypothetical protein
MQFRRKWQTLPVVLSVEEVCDLLMAPWAGLKYRAALSISYWAAMLGSGTMEHCPQARD